MRRWLIRGGVLAAATLLTLGVGCGRSASRILGESARQIIEIPDMKSFVSISFDTRGDATVKDVTYVAEDGYTYTQEFKDLSPMEGLLRWVPHTESASIIQSRTISRLFGTAVDLRMPEDCQRILGVDIVYLTEDERAKNLTCLTTDGRVLVREYREGLIDRHLDGWLEVRAEKK